MLDNWKNWILSTIPWCVGAVRDEATWIQAGMILRLYYAEQHYDVSRLLCAVCAAIWERGKRQGKWGREEEGRQVEKTGEGREGESRGGVTGEKGKGG